MKSVLKTVIPAQITSIGDALDFVEDSLKQFKFKQKYVHEAMLLSEECMIRLIQRAPSGGTLHIHIRKKRGLAEISISCPGPELQPDSMEFDIGIESDTLERGNESAIRGILLKAYQNKIRYARKGKYNFMRVTVGSPEQVLAIHTLQALIVASALGLLFRFILPAEAKTALVVYLLLPIETLFINFLMLVTAPAIFFSIISAVARYASFSDPGKVSAKVFGGYAFTSVIAVLIGMGAFFLFSPGTPGELSRFFSQTGSAPQTDFLKTVTGIVPTNIIEPFLNSNTLQLIFVAIICGIALGRMGDYSSPLRLFAEAMDTLVAKVIEIVAKCVPLATFAAACAFLMSVDLHVVVSLLAMLGTLLAALVGICLVYLLIVLIVAGVNPITFLRKCLPIMREAFIVGDRIAAIPKTMRTCKNSLGISPKVNSFSIPFGAIVNVDGNCIYLAVAGLFLARLCGVDMFGTELLSIMLTVFILSVGAPIAPGSVNICLTVLLSQMGVSLSAISIIIGINAIVEMCLAASNVVGDIAVSIAVAKSENLLNTEVFNAKPRKR